MIKEEAKLTHNDLPIYSFENEADFWNWLSKNYQQSTSFWLRFYKKESKVPSIHYDEAVDVALCFGWIDGLANKYDEESYLVRYTPRRPKSVWSKINVAKVNKLIDQKRMQPSGLAKVDAAKEDGRWKAAY
jgi:uncharacterized protein YdeI (YjbR/CyaY-like superfamily)